jgi:hypothetical protein
VPGCEYVPPAGHVKYGFNLDCFKIGLMVLFPFFLAYSDILSASLRKDIQGAYGTAAVYVTCGSLFATLFVIYTWRS